METDALNRPPERLEKLVLLATPPAAREAVMGDLCETYQSPAQYVAEALRTVPFVVASQMRRNANLPALGLQGFLAFFYLGGFAGPAQMMRALAGTAAALLVLTIRDAYQAIERQASRRAMGETILVVFAMLLFCLTLAFGVQATKSRLADDLLWLQLSFLAPMLFPMLCLFRAGLIVEGDYRAPFPAGEISQETVLGDYRRFERRLRRRGRIEALALLMCALLALVLQARLNTPFSAIGLGMVSVYALVALYLLLEGGARALPARVDFLSLRALYQQELMRQQQLRRFLWWLWCAPMLLAVHTDLIEGGRAAGRSVMLVSGTAGAILLCYLVNALNREYGGRIQEKIGLLDRA